MDESTNEQVVTVNDVGADSEPAKDPEVRSEESAGDAPNSDAAVVVEAPVVESVTETATEAATETRSEAEFDSSLIELLRSTIVESLMEQIGSKIDGLKDEVSTLRSENAELVTRNESLASRLKVVEDQPMSSPGILANVDQVTRSDNQEVSKEQKRAEAIKRAKESGDKEEAIRLLTNKDYTGR